MTLPYVPDVATERCPRCAKKLAVDLGQDADTGWVHEHLSCWSCGYEVRERAWPHRTATVLTVREILARRRSFVDRELPVSEIAKMSREEFEEWANGAHA